MIKITLENIRPLKVTEEGLLPGVKKVGNKYQARISKNGKNTYIGSFGSNLKAGIAYMEERIKQDKKYLAVFTENLSDFELQLIELKKQNGDL